jgi:hypothetical protein
MQAGSHYRILKEDAVRPYSDLAPTLRDDASPRFPFLGFLGGHSPRFPNHGGCYPAPR